MGALLECVKEAQVRLSKAARGARFARHKLRTDGPLTAVERWDVVVVFRRTALHSRVKGRDKYQSQSSSDNTRCRAPAAVY
jgi:hypothetical protein